MKAIRVKQYGEPEVMKLEEMAEFTPTRGQVVVKLLAAGVNPVDDQCRAGLHSWTSIPYTPGIDGAGIITSVGEDVKDRKIGERVYTAFPINGTYAEEVLCQSDQVYPLPENVSFEEGAALSIPYGTAYRAIFQRSNLKTGETVLVHGASGAVGIACTQFLHELGNTFIGTAGTEQGRELVLVQGAHHVLNHYDDLHYQQVLDLTNGNGVDVIIEMVSANIKRDINILAKKGRIIVIGDRTPIEIDAAALTSRDASILGTNIGNLPPETAQEMHNDLYKGLQNGSLKPIICQRLPLTEAVKAHEILYKPETFGKIVLVP